MGSLVIAVYRPKRGKLRALLDLVREHVPTLRGLGLATPREAIVGKAKDGSVVEIFEWTSADAIDRAHHDPVVQRMWKRFNAVSTYASLSALAEAEQPFPSFEPIDLGPRVGSVDWLDMTGPKAAALKRFYGRVVGLAPQGVSMGDYEDWAMLAPSGRAVCGICHDRGANAEVPGGWLPYFTVASLTRSVAAAKRLGGAVVDGPRAGGGGRFVILRDPAGTHLALYEAKRQPSREPRRTPARGSRRSGSGASKRRSN